jgi:cytochrome c oxidase cbb3-type subunit 4
MHNMQQLFGTLSGIFTAVLIVLMTGIAAWAWSGKRREAFDAAARAPLEEDSALDKPSHGERVP